VGRHARRGTGDLLKLVCRAVQLLPVLLVCGLCLLGRGLLRRLALCRTLDLVLELCLVSARNEGRRSEEGGVWKQGGGGAGPLRVVELLFCL
jgi:hypothetical protein